MKAAFNFYSEELLIDNMSNERIEWLDSLKGLAILFVVLGHILLGFIENNAFPDINNTLEKIDTWIYSWHMPLFFFLSGFAFDLSYIKEGNLDIKKVKKNTFNLFLLYILFQIGLCSLKMIFTLFVDNKVNAEELLYIIIFPNTLMWYLWVLVIYYLFFGNIVLNKIDKLVNKKYIELTLFIIYIVMIYISENYPLRLCFQNLFSYAFFFYEGICGNLKNTLKNNKLLFITVIYVICYAVGSIYISVDIVFLKVILKAVNAVFLISLLYRIFKLYVIGNNSLLKNLGKASLVIYLLHTYFVTALKVIFIRYPIGRPILIIFITLCISIMITYFIYYLSKRIRFLGIIFRPISLLDKPK